MPDLKRFAWFAVLLAPIAACPLGRAPVVPGGPGARPCPALIPTAIGIDPTCPDFGCGTNSPTVGDGVVFDELDSSGRDLTRRGVRIDPDVSLPDPTTHVAHHVTLHVDRHFLYAVESTTGTRYEGAELKGATFRLTGATSVGVTRKYELVIVDYFDSIQTPALHFWSGDTSESVPFYLIESRPADSNKTLTPICKESTEPVWTPVRNFAIVFKGDRYDAVHKTVSDTDDATPWFNLACAGAAPAKMHMMRHTNAAARISPRDGIYQTTPAERTAMLKMFTADYCGDGTAYTVDGQALLWGDDRHQYPATPTITSSTLPPPLCTIESLWTERGAACIDTPRRARRTDIICPGSRVIPTCGGAAGVRGWDSGGWDARAGAHVHVISAN